MAISVRLSQRAKSLEGVQQWPYRAVAEAMEVIPRTLVQNAGASPIRALTQLRAKHAEGAETWGINGDTGAIVDMNQYGVWEPEAVKLQSMKTAVEVRTIFIFGWSSTNFASVSVSSSPSRRHLQRQIREASRWWSYWRRRGRLALGLVEMIVS